MSRGIRKKNKFRIIKKFERDNPQKRIGEADAVEGWVVERRRYAETSSIGA
jgi:hypothetical protein